MFLNIFEHPAQDTYRSVDRIRAGVDRGYTRGSTKGSAAGAASVYNLRLPTEGLRPGHGPVASARI